jgi:CelD/BcsL family acetyltransferase involved in cellulose biosynthesis
VNIYTKIINEDSDFLKLKSQWNSFFEQIPDKNPFASFDWMYNWWKSFKDNKSVLNIMLIYENEELIGIIPLFYKKKFHIYKEYQFIGTGISDFLNILYLDKKFETVLNYFFSYLKTNMQTWDIIDLQDLYLDSKNVKIIIEKCKTFNLKPIHRIQDQNPFINMNNESWEKYLIERKKGFKKKVFCEERRLKGKGNIKVEKITGFEINNNKYPDIFQLARSIEKKSWKFSNGTESINKSKNSQDFFMNILKNFSSKKQLDFWIYYLDEIPRSYSINFNIDGKIFYYNPAYDEEISSFGPGALILIDSIRDAFKNNMREYHFLRGNEEYKFPWANETIDLYEIVISKNIYHPKKSYFYLRWVLAKSQIIINANSKIGGLVNRLRRKNR